MAKINGRRIELTKDRSVFVGQKEGCDDYYIQFKHGTSLQRFRISEEAASALRDLLDSCVWACASENVGKAEPHLENTPIGDGYWRWHPIKEMDA